MASSDLLHAKVAFLADMLESEHQRCKFLLRLVLNGTGPTVAGVQQLHDLLTAETN
jgi:hypothetical protein